METKIYIRHSWYWKKPEGWLERKVVDIKSDYDYGSQPLAGPSLYLNFPEYNVSDLIMSIGSDSSFSKS